MSQKTFKVVGNDISDGYHTFDELYEHRCLLWIALCRRNPWQFEAVWYPEHFEGWDLLTAETDAGQISYHVPMKYRPLYENHICKALTLPHFDGHTSADVVKRLTELLSDR